MDKEQLSYVKQWQNEVFDEKKQKDTLNALLFAEIKRFSVFLNKNQITVPNKVIDAYKEERNFN